MVMKAIIISIWLTILLPEYVVVASASTKSAISDPRRNGERRLADVGDKSGYISIDCGATESSKFNNVSYDTDEQYIATGSNMAIDSEYVYDGLDPAYKTVRSFPDGGRNCYTLKPANGRDTNYLIRAMFMYGNYDLRNITPTFDVYIGVNFWDTIALQSAWQKLFIEILHKPTANSIYFCLVDIGKGTPFISQLVLRPLDDSLYNVSESASLYTHFRYDTGRAEEYSGYTSYPSGTDVYDRFWSPIPLRFLSNWENYSTIEDFSSLRNDAYKLPPSIFKAGVRPRGGNHSLNFFYTPNYLSDELYFYLHFAETQKIGRNKFREVSVFTNGKPITKPIKLRYLEALTLPSSQVKLESGYQTIWLSINQTTTSTLPPILNALEMYIVKELPQSATNQDDVNAIMEVKTKYEANGLMKIWQGDPCLPVVPWDGLNCSDNGNDSPRIISLNLSSKSLGGEILSSFSSLKSLTYLDLSNNNLTGTIPDFLADMPSLQAIDLSGNKLSGSVPSILIDRTKNGSLSLRLEGNPDLCISEPCGETSKNNTGLCNSDTCREKSKEAQGFGSCGAAPSLFVVAIAIACAVVCA